jgi:hypothetical protein
MSAMVRQCSAGAKIVDMRLLAATLFGFNLLAAPPLAPTRVALLGEQTTHSLHRDNDPEFPLFLGQRLDVDFKADAAAAPTGGGFLTGGGTHYRVGNFGHPQGSVIDHALENPKSVLRSEELKLAEKFAPAIVVLGPFGDHESLTQVGLEHFAPDLGALIEKIAAFPSHPKLYLALPIPRGGKDEDENYRRFRNETKAIADERRLEVIDLWAEFLGRGDLFQDATHLTVPGRKELARIVAEAITAGRSTKKPGKK